MRTPIRLAALSVLLFALAAEATEVLVLNSAATQVDTSAASNRSSFEIQNLGPNPIYCEVGGATPVLTKSRRLITGESWSMNADRSQTVSCRAATADQVTGAATIYSEVK